jgi:UDP-N-acetylglucosamine 2-epimerase (non-hydrolysing)
MKAVLDLVVGARPNFVKIAPVVRATLSGGKLQPVIVHTGQHYDHGMDDVFFKELRIPAPDVHLEVGSGTHGAQTAKILERYEAHLMKTRPDATVVFGDVNSTVACALAAVKLGIPVAHVEAGLRSFDRTMPEEINRLLTDAIADLLLVSEPSGVTNLAREGADDSKIRLVGNVMIDTLVEEFQEANSLNAYEQFGYGKGEYALLTMHRPSNVDDPKVLGRLLNLFLELSKEIPIIFPAHPRTLKAALKAGFSDLFGSSDSFLFVDPLPYRNNLSLMSQAKLVLTDSGGVQEETTYLKKPCLTLRENTERPITVDKGTSRLVGNDSNQIRSAFKAVLAGRWPEGEAIPLWDGHASERVVSELEKWLEDTSGGKTNV